MCPQNRRISIRPRRRRKVAQHVKLHCVHSLWGRKTKHFYDYIFKLAYLSAKVREVLFWSLSLPIIWKFASPQRKVHYMYSSSVRKPGKFVYSTNDTDQNYNYCVNSMRYSSLLCPSSSAILGELLRCNDASLREKPYKVVARTYFILAQIQNSFENQEQR